MEWKHTDSPVKKKFRVQCSVRKIMLTVFSYMKGPITIDFLEELQLQTVLPIPNSFENIHLINWMTLVYIKTVSSKYFTSYFPWLTLSTSTSILMIETCLFIPLLLMFWRIWHRGITFNKYTYVCQGKSLIKVFDHRKNYKKKSSNGLKVSLQFTNKDGFGIR